MGTPIHAIVAILGRNVAFLGSPIIPVTLFVFSLEGKAAVLSSIIMGSGTMECFHRYGEGAQFS